MKKFISLALALVMALSLATVAWGANEAKFDGTEYATVEEAVAAANTAGSGTVTMLTDATVEATLVLDGITLDGDGFTLTSTVSSDSLDDSIRGDADKSAIYTNIGCTILNLTIDGGWKGVMIRETATQATLLDNVHVEKSARGLCFTENSGVVSAADLTVKNSTLAGWNSVSTTGTVVFENTTFAANASTRGNGLNPRGNTDLNDCFVEEGVKLTTEDLAADEAIAINGGVYNGELADVGAGTFAISGGTFSVLPDEDYLVDGVSFVGNTVGVLDKKATTYDNLYAKSTDMAATDPTTEVDIVVTPAKAAKYDKTTGEIEDMGNVEYVCITGDGTYYVFVKTLAEADVVLYKDAAGKQVKFYLAEVETPYYFEGAAFNNFGDKCGQVDYDDYDKTLKYFTIKGFDAFILVEEAEEFACDAYVLYNGKMIPVVALGLDKVPHTAIYTSKNGVVESIECGACGLKAAKVPNALSMPKDADVVTGETLWYWPSAATSTGTTTDKTVQSAQTFDAGIAMYVGMSVMAAAGSAVVLKKKD